MSNSGYIPTRHDCGQIIWIGIETGSYWDNDPDHGFIRTTCPHCHQRLGPQGFEAIRKGHIRIRRSEEQENAAG